MAEVLGIIASGIAVEQFAESVLKLKRLCSAFRNAPEYVTQLAEELDVITALLVEVDGQRQQPYHAASSATTWEKCVLACKNAGKASESVIKVLEKQLKTNRTLGGIRVAFKKEAIAELRSRLERAKSTLVLAQQTYLNARLDYVFKTQLMELQNIKSVLTLSLNARPVASVLPPEPQEESTALLRTPYTCTGLEVTQRTKKPTRYRRKLLSIRIPNWISSTIWEAELTKISTSGWTFSLTSYAIVDWHSPVVQATFEGRLADLQYLFSSGQASPFLRDDTGATLLHGDDVEWRRLLREAVAIDAHCCAFEHDISPFCAFIQGWLNKGGSRDHTAALRNWILELQAADANILQYGEQEKRLWTSTRKASNQILVQPCPARYPDYFCGVISCDAHTVTTIINFACGPRSEDWQISLAPYQDESSERYCDMVENGRDDGIELRIPGIWPKDEYSKDGYDEEHYREFDCDLEADEFCVEYFQLRNRCWKCRRKGDRLFARLSLEQKRECFEVS